MTGELHKTPFKAVIKSDNQAPPYILKILIYLMIIFHLDELNNSLCVRKPNINIFIFPYANAPILTFRCKKNASDPAGVMCLNIGQATLIAPNISCSN